MIDFKQISKSYGGQVIFDNISVRINSGEKAGIVGPNGCGKSTLFGAITGEVDIDAGKVEMPSDLRIGYLRQHLPEAADGTKLLDFTADAIPELKHTAARLKEIEHLLEDENLEAERKDSLLNEHGHLQSAFEHAGGYRLRSEAAAALSGLGFAETDFTRELGDFSGGWQMRAALGRVLISNPDIMLLDEPSNYLDIPAVEWLYRYLSGFNGTLLLISHDRYLLRKLTNITIEINGGAATRYAGDYDYYRRERANRMLSLEAAQRNQNKKKEQLQRNINRFRSKSSKAAQAQSWIKQLEKMEDIVVPDQLKFSGAIKIPDAPPCGAEAFRFENVSFGYNEKKTVLADISLALESGLKTAFIGYNGTGKTTLLKLLGGILKPQSGRVVIGHNVIMGYQAQEFADILPPENSVRDVVRSAVKKDMSVSALNSVLGAFGFSGDNIDKPCKVLSGGEKIRLCFARIFVDPPNLLVLDEPTTHLDIASREALQVALREFKGTLCLVSHDIEFVNEVADTIIAMRPPGIKRYYGGYDYYLEKSALESNPEAAPAVAAVSAGGETARERRKKRAQKRRELSASKKAAQRQVDDLEERLENLEMERNEILELMAMENPDFTALNIRLAKTQKNIDKTTSEWEHAAEKLEAVLELYAQIAD